MKVFIITEGGRRFGFGHVTRCISLYQAYAQQKIRAQILVNADNSVRSVLKDTNYMILDWLKHRNRLLRLISGSDIVIVDSYMADYLFYIKISRICRIAIYIDDNKRVSFPEGTVLNGSIYAETLNYPERKGVDYLLGVLYVPVRKAFWNAPRKVISKNVKSVMISFGGTKKVSGAMREVLKFLGRQYPGLKKNVVMGGIPNKEAADVERCGDSNTRFIYAATTDRLKHIMLKADLAISAGGQTLYELARIGVPTIGICIADNQRRNILGWQRAGFLTQAASPLHKNLILAMDGLASKAKRERISRIGRALVDGRGAERVVKQTLRLYAN